MSEEEIIEIFDNLKEYIQDKINRGEHKIYYNDLMWEVKCVDCISAMDNILDLYNKEKEKNEKMYKQLQDIHDNFLKFNWQESNSKQMHNQLADLYESIYRRNN